MTVSLKTVLEALLFSSDTPLSIAELKSRLTDCDQPLLETISKETIEAALMSITDDYQGRGVSLREVASGYQFEVQADTLPWVQAMLQEKPLRYSRAVLETLAVIAYHQPVTRADIEAVRGVAVSTTTVKTLLERDWIKIIGQRDVPGKPSVFATTNAFLDHFGLSQLSELPQPSEEVLPTMVDMTTTSQPALIAQDEMTETTTQTENIEADHDRITR